MRYKGTLSNNPNVRLETTDFEIGNPAAAQDEFMRLLLALKLDLHWLQKRVPDKDPLLLNRIQDMEDTLKKLMDYTNRSQHELQQPDVDSTPAANRESVGG
jgi:hypothetical protein